jgi:hypothetical protein
MLAYSKSTDATVDVDITPVQDDIIAIQNAHFFPQKPVKVVEAFATGTTLIRAKIVTPALRQLSPPFIRPINAANLPGSLPAVADYSQNPLLLNALEEIQVLATQSAAGPTQVNVGLLIDTGITPPMPQGQVITMRGTAATTVVANAWTSVTTTWADTLPNGRYACVGLQTFGTTNVLSRLIFDGQLERPGCVGAATAANNPYVAFRKGFLGVYGYFTSNQMPIVQFLCNVADTAQEIYLDFVRVG